MLTKRVVPCLDVRDGKVVKGVNFAGIKEVGDPVELARRYSSGGAGELVVNSIDADGVRGGFDTEMLSAFAAACPVPIVASGGAGKPDDFVKVFGVSGVDAALAAGIFHEGRTSVREVKETMKAAGLPVRL